MLRLPSLKILQSLARFIRRISAVSNAIETMDNEMICLIIFCLNAFDTAEMRRMNRAFVSFAEIFFYYFSSNTLQLFALENLPCASEALGSMLYFKN